MRRRVACVVALLALVGLTAGAGRAAGPMLVNGAGAPLVWGTSPIPFNPDRGNLGALPNATAVATLTADFAIWSSVPASSIAFTNGGAMPVDVTAANYTTYVGVCGDGLDPIVFDTDGSITDALFGVGASNDVLGFAGPDCWTHVPPIITEASAVFNGKWVDGVNAPGNPELPLADFNATIIHELGHYLNLDHSQVNHSEAFDGNPADDAAIPTMFPLLVNGVQQALLTLDDRVSAAMLYPAPSFASSFGTIRGRVLHSDGLIPFQGANVIARSVVDPRGTAVGMVSGARYFPGNPGGPPAAALEGEYTLPGLPPGTYTVEVEPVLPIFTGGSGVGPLDPPAMFLAIPELWSGANEDSTNPPDDPAVGVPLTVTAGATQSDIDLVMNAASPAANDTCAAGTVLPAAPFSELIDTTLTTKSTSDPFQSCSATGPAQNSNSVWYRFTPPANGTVRFDTFGSSYDTVVTVYVGTCASVSEVACDDDAGPGLQSEVAFPVTAGTLYLIEVTKFGPPAGGALAVDFAFLLGCGNGTLDAGEACDDGPANGNDGCCSTVCQVVDADGDGVCDRDDVCPTMVDPAQTDSDADGLGDACDLCRTLGPGQTDWPTRKLVFNKLGDGVNGNDRLRMRGHFSMGVPTFAVDPQARGLWIEVRSGSRVPKLRINLLPGTYTEPGPGWIKAANGSSYVFRNLNPGGTQGITKVLLKDRGDGSVLVVVVGKNATFPLIADDVPLSATVVLGDAQDGVDGKCGEIAFPGPAPGPACKVNRNRTRVTCR